MLLSLQINQTFSFKLMNMSLHIQLLTLWHHYWSKLDHLINNKTPDTEEIEIISEVDIQPYVEQYKTTLWTMVLFVLVQLSVKLSTNYTSVAS